MTTAALLQRARNLLPAMVGQSLQSYQEMIQLRVATQNFEETVPEMTPEQQQHITETLRLIYEAQDYYAANRPWLPIQAEPARPADPQNASPRQPQPAANPAPAPSAQNVPAALSCWESASALLQRIWEAAARAFSAFWALLSSCFRAQTAQPAQPPLPVSQPVAPVPTAPIARVLDWDATLRLFPQLEHVEMNPPNQTLQAAINTLLATANRREESLMLGAVIMKGEEAHAVLIDSRNAARLRFYHFNSRGENGNPATIQISANTRAVVAKLSDILGSTEQSLYETRFFYMPRPLVPIDAFPLHNGQGQPIQRYVGTINIAEVGGAGVCKVCALQFLTRLWPLIAVNEDLTYQGRGSQLIDEVLREGAAKVRLNA